MYQETCKLYNRVMKFLDHEEGNKERKNTDVASVVSIDSIFVGTIMVVLVMEIQVEEVSSSIGVVEGKFFIC